jgi:hypothetical protein
VRRQEFSLASGGVEVCACKRGGAAVRLRGKSHPNNVSAPDLDIEHSARLVFPAVTTNPHDWDHHARLSGRAAGTISHKQKAITDGHWHEAHEAEVRRGVWLAAAEMAQQQASALT